jgi:IPT/TIG domain/PASTA domain
MHPSHEPRQRLATPRSAALTLILICAALWSGAGAAQAAPVTVGSSLTNMPLFSACSIGTSTCTLVQRTIGGATVVSPVDGAIVSWHLLGGSANFYHLQVLSFVNNGPAPDGSEPVFQAQHTSAAGRPAGAGLETFPTALPIAAGQVIGLTMEPNASIAQKQTTGSDFMVFFPALNDGVPMAGKLSRNASSEFGFNAVVQPAPTITSVKPASGPPAGGNSVVIEGTQFANVTRVAFGANAASSFSVDSEGKITAVAPAERSLQVVPVSVTTAAGTASLGQAYTYAERVQETPQGTPQERPRQEEAKQPGQQGADERCRVPKLKGKKLASAKTALRGAHCAVGQVKRRRGATARSAKVVAQSPRPGMVLPPGTKVRLTLAAG